MWYMNVERSITTTADPGRAWRAVSAVTTMPRWTPSMTSVTALDGEELAVGRRFRIKQPGFPPLVWRVTEIDSEHSFTWVARSPGVRTLAYHHVSTDADGATRITIGIRQTGPLAGLVARFTGARTERYLGLEAAGLKASAESMLAAG
jgi:uncharacterized protein YndB with AHSA1/START domain